MNCPICQPQQVEMVEVGNIMVCPECDLQLVLVREVRLVRNPDPDLDPGGRDSFA